MNTTNFPVAKQQNAPVQNKTNNYKNLVIGVLAATTLGLASFAIYNKSNNENIIKKVETQLSAVTTEKSNLQSSFDASLARLDSMKTVNTDLNNKLSGKTDEIAKVKTEIRSILSKKNATNAELEKAKNLIANLNEKISGLMQDVAKLTEENKTLTQDKETLTQEKTVLTQDKEKLTKDLTTTVETKQALEKKVDIASTLNASNIDITPFNVKKNGKEKESTKAKKVEKLVVSFDLTNRIAQAGLTDVYILVIGPDGNHISTTGTFETKDEGAKNYTAKLPIKIETAHLKNVEYAFTPGTKFAKGNYKIQIYNNGFLIGEGTRELKKGGLFG